MYDFYSGTRYTLERKEAREVEITAIVIWREPGLKGRRVLHCLFSMSKRQAAKYGKATAPKLLLNRVYAIRRPDGESIFVRLYRQAIGQDSKRFLWMKKVKKPADWID